MKYILSILTVFFGLAAMSQNNQGKQNDAARIALSAYVPEQIEGMPDAARNTLVNKLNQLITQNGMGASARLSRFVLGANVAVVSKDITSTAPPMHAYVLEVTFIIGDATDGTKFASHTVTLKGVDENETKVYNSALKNLKGSDPKFQTFITNGKNKIIEYYNTRCDFILKEAETMAAQNNFEGALMKLTSVPEVCIECYNKCMDAAGPMYRKFIDRDCKIKMTQAESIWAANQSWESAQEVGAIISSIDPAAACYGEVKALNTKVAARVKELDAREWQYIIKDQLQESERIQAMRDIGVAYGNGQPQTVTTNFISGWWGGQ